MINPFLVTLPEVGAFGSAVTRVFPDSVYESLSKAVKELDWHEARREFYRQSERNVAGHSESERIFDKNYRQEMADAVGDFFGQSVAPDFDIAAR